MIPRLASRSSHRSKPNFTESTLWPKLLETSSKCVQSHPNRCRYYAYVFSPEAERWVLFCAGAMPDVRVQPWTAWRGVVLDADKGTPERDRAPGGAQGKRAGRLPHRIRVWTGERVVIEACVGCSRAL